MTPINQTIDGSDPMMSGFDIDFSRLIFNRMLGLDLHYVAYGTFTEMYMYLRSGECDVSEMDPGRTICLGTCDDEAMMHYADTCGPRAAYKKALRKYAARLPRLEIEAFQRNTAKAARSARVTLASPREGDILDEDPTGLTVCVRKLTMSASFSGTDVTYDEYGEEERHEAFYGQFYREPLDKWEDSESSADDDDDTIS